MSADPTVLVIVAHPDDETFGPGSVIAAAATRGWRVEVCSATLGEAGEPAPRFHLDGRSLAEHRTHELRAAAAHLGATCLPPLGLADSGWDGEPPAGSLCGIAAADLVDRVGTLIRRRHPDVVLTLSGDDGHRDHQRLADAVTAAFDRDAATGASLYQWCLPNRLMRRWADEVARIRPDTAHLALAELGTHDDAISTRIDGSPQLARRREAIAIHASQVSPYDGLSSELEEAFLTADNLIRIRPTWDGGPLESWLSHTARRIG